MIGRSRWLLLLFAIGLAMSSCSGGSVGRKEQKVQMPPLGLFDYVGQGDVRKVEELLDKGIDINATNQWHANQDSDVKDIPGNNETALHIAASSPGPEMLKLLIKRGAYIDAGDINGFSPLMRAVVQNDPEKVKILIESGADLNRKNIRGESALDVAKRFESPDLVRILRKASK
jgi:ankyrin repeat protein